MTRVRMMTNDEPAEAEAPSPRTTIVGGQPEKNLGPLPPVPPGGPTLRRMAALDPFAYIVHFSNTSLVPMDALEAHEWPRWRARLDRSVSELVAGGIAPERLCVETLSYDFGHVAPLVEEHDLSICLDIGHLLLKGQLPDTYLDRYLPRTRVLHVHGIHDGKDHASLRYLDETVLADLVERRIVSRQPGLAQVLVHIEPEM